MKKRLRKKLRVGEFLEHGFWVFTELTPGLPRSTVEVMLGEFYEQCLKSRGLRMNYGYPGDEGWDLFVVLDGRGDPTEAQRDSVVEWLRSRPNIVSARAGEFEALC